MTAVDEEGRELSKLEFEAYVLSVSFEMDTDCEHKITTFSNGCILTQTLDKNHEPQLRPDKPFDA
jgi:hypothetical protein